MIKFKKFILFIVLVINLQPSSVFANEAAKMHIDAVGLFNGGEYSQSAELFEKLAETGIVNGSLFYNLGNAYFKSGNQGKAILWYERAKKLIPGDPDLKFNMNYAEGFVEDKIEDKSFSLYRIIFFWKHIIGRSLIQWTGISLFFLFWMMIIFQMVKGRKLIKTHTSITFVLSCIFILTSVHDYYADNYKKKAVILDEIVHVRSGLTGDSTELFILHTGTRVKVEDERKGYLKIRFSDDKIGWVKSEGVEII